MGKRKSSAHPPKPGHPWLHQSRKGRPSRALLLAQEFWYRRERALINYLIRAKYMAGL
jgi:hypothetical protein